jgi:BirA family biotin operon repressor/biotin-[acetyl-CoA-carboxylase] ligase
VAVLYGAVIAGNRLDAGRLARAAGPPWRPVVVHRTESTNAVVAEAARRGERAGLAVFAEEQTAGRGRLGRVWHSPAGSGLTGSVLLRPRLPVEQLGWLPLAAGLAVRDVAAAAGVPARLKWPNDVLAGRSGSGGKLAGVLAERVPPEAIVVGVGLNVLADPAELPPGAASLRGAGGRGLDRTALAAALLHALAGWLAELDPPGRPPRAPALIVRPAYRQLCATLRQAVALQLPDGSTLAGRAVDVDPAGRLVVARPDGSRLAVSSGEVLHASADG